MSGNRADLNLHFGVEGGSDVQKAFDQWLNGLKQVQAEEKKLAQEEKVRAASEAKAAEARKKNFSSDWLKSEGQKIGAMFNPANLIPAASIYAVVAGFKSLISEANAFALTMSALHKQTGFSTEELSVWGYAAKKAGKDLETITKPLQKMSKFIGDTRLGNQKAMDISAQLFGGNGKSDPFKGLTDDQALEKVTKRIAEMKDSTEKTSVVIAMLGKNGAEAIPFLDKLGGSFEKMKKEAQESGLIVGPELAAGIKQSKEQMNALHMQSLGLAMQFSSGLTPALGQAFTGLMKATAIGGQAAGGFKKLGEIIGWVGKGIASAFIYAGSVVGTFAAIVAEVFGDIWENLKAFFGSIADFDISHPIDSAKRIWSEFAGKNSQARREVQGARMESVMGSFADAVTLNDPETNKSLDAIWNQKAPQAKDEADGPGKKPGKEKKEKAEKDWARQIQEASKAAEQARIEAERKIADAVLDEQERANERLYKKGLEGTQAYYDEKRRIVLAKQKEENDLLAAEYANATGKAAGPDTLVSVEAQLADLRAMTLTEQNEIDKQKQIKELEALRAKLVEKQKKDKEAILTIDEAVASQKFKDAEKAASDSLKHYQDKANEIREGYDNGKYGGIARDSKLRDLGHNSIGDLREQADQMDANAGNDQEKIAKSKEFRAEVEKWALALQQADTAFQGLKTSMAQGFVSDFTDAFMSLVDGTKSLSEAFQDMAKSFIHSLLRMTTEALAWLVISKMLGINPSSGGNALSQAISGAFTHKATGGWINGPGSGTSDSVPLMASNGEFVMRTAAASTFPNGMLEDLNRNGMPALHRWSTSAFADSGVGGAAQSSFSGHLVVSPDNGAVARMVDEHISGPGFKTVISAANRNQKAMNAALGRNG